MKKEFVLVLLLALATAQAATVTIRPDGQGNYVAWTDVNCAYEWQCVDEAVPSTSDYLRASSQVKETFTFSDTGLNTEGINSVTLYFYALQYKNQDKCFEALIRSAGTDYLSGNQICGTTSWALYSETYAVNPATGSAWTVSEVNALEAGMSGLDPNGGGSIAQVYAVVDYTPNSCDDTDGGQVPSVFGTAYGILGGSSYSVDDACYNAGSVTEQYCSGSSRLSTVISCGTDYHGSIYCVGDDLYWNFTDFSCSAGACSSTTVPQYYSTCSYDCVNNTCILPPDSCNETDGGIDSLAFGVISGFYFGGQYSVSDFCIGSNVFEYYCSGTSPRNTTLFCSQGCADGACITVPDSCTETDSGLDYGVAGEVYGVNNNWDFNYTDYCSDQSHLVEYYCDGTAWNLQMNVSCTCIDGACI